MTMIEDTLDAAREKHAAAAVSTLEGGEMMKNPVDVVKGEAMIANDSMTKGRDMTTPIYPRVDDRLQGKTVVCSVSGGKDSAAMSLWLRERGIEHRCVFMDTGWESDVTYEYLRGELTRVLGPIEEIRGPRTMEELCVKKGMFPSRLRRFCTGELKIKPIIKYINALVDAGHECVDAVGIRKAESRARSQMTEWEFSEAFDCWVWRPLIELTELQVIDIHHRHGLRLNPLYLKGASRVGCFPCIFSRKSEIRFIADHYPARIDKVRELERVVGDRADSRANSKGEVVRHRPTFFQGATQSSKIDEAVAWSRTSRGGKQWELFDSTDRDAGCMRWGLCEHNDKG
jgi:3'-phosphoadenosine 5'-phosphosulfate sulfotransferase (PAPS reductase)/FAD synthetase